MITGEDMPDRVLEVRGPRTLVHPVWFCLALFLYWR